MRIKELLFFGLLIVTSTLNAQTDFRPGYVIEHSGDTLYGTIDYQKSSLLSRTCRFKSSNNDLYEYSPNDIAAYRFADSKFFVSREVNHGQVFLEYLIKGGVNIYYLYDKQGHHYYIDKDGVELSELYYEEGIKTIEDKSVFYESTSHVGLLKFYMQDAPELQSSINSIKKPEHNNLIKLAEDYHNAVCDDGGCMIYERKMPFVKMSIEPLVGLIRFGSEGFVINSGVYLYICSQRSNENIFLKTGLDYSSFLDEEEKIKVFRIPIQCQYIYQAKIIQPKIGGGLNIYAIKPDGELGIAPILALNAGLDYEISKRSFLSTTLNFDFIPYSWVSYSLTIGLRFNL